MPRKVMNCQGFCKLFHAVFRHIFLYFMIISFFNVGDGKSFLLSVLSKNYNIVSVRRF